jgi:hypothetical protein
MNPTPSWSEKVAREFEEKFGKDGPDRNSDSIGRKAGCDDCFTSIELRREHKEFLLSKIEEAREKGLMEVRDDIDKAIAGRDQGEILVGLGIARGIIRGKLSTPKQLIN